MPTEDVRLNRTGAFLIALAIWAGIYLPALGTPELDGSEGRRVLPALSMLETGDWIVPHMGGEPYYRKPPMINWMIGVSFTLTGRQSEQSARLCSALSVLAFVCLLIWAPGTWLSPAARLVIAMIFLTSVGIVEKGRRIEIDAIYAAMTATAVFWWLNAWLTGGSRWSLWMVPSFVLACGMLTKGPLIFLLYYLTVICVLAYSRQMRSLLSIPHIAGVVLSLGIPLAWALSASRQGGAEAMTSQTSLDVMLRLIPEQMDWLRWGRRVAGGPLSFLPWLVLVPVLWSRTFLAALSERQRIVFKGCRLGLCLGFIAIALMPGTKARYMLPIIGPAAILLGWLLSATAALPDGGRRWRSLVLGGFLLSAGAGVAGIVLADRDLHAFLAAALAVGAATIAFRRRETLRTPLHLSVACGVLTAVLVLEYGAFILPAAVRRERYRPVAARINALVPDRETLHVFRPGNGTAWPNLLFYVAPRPEYVVKPDQIDSHVEYLLVHESDYEKLAEEAGISSRLPAASLYRFTEDRHLSLRLLRLSVPPAELKAQPGPASDPM